MWGSIVGAVALVAGTIGVGAVVSNHHDSGSSASVSVEPSAPTVDPLAGGQLINGLPVGLGPPVPSPIGYIKPGQQFVSAWTCTVGVVAYDKVNSPVVLTANQCMGPVGSSVQVLAKNSGKLEKRGAVASEGNDLGIGNFRVDPGVPLSSFIQIGSDESSPAPRPVDSTTLLPGDMAGVITLGQDVMLKLVSTENGRLIYQVKDEDKSAPGPTASGAPVIEVGNPQPGEGFTLVGVLLDGTNRDHIVVAPVDWTLSNNGLTLCPNACNGADTSPIAVDG
jgi:hypothetical protein